MVLSKRGNSDLLEQYPSLPGTMKTKLGILGILVLLLGIKDAAAIQDTPILLTVMETEAGGVTMVPGLINDSKNTFAMVNFTNSINKTGWNYLEVSTNGNQDDLITVSIMSKFR